jgi:predicted phage-related endonuclease
MIIHDFIQGSPEWLQHRAPPLRNASESPNVMGEGYISRSEFLRQWVTGITPGIDAPTQALFDDGHHAEQLALPLMEKLVGEPLYQITGTHGKYGASFDGLTISENIGAEHKKLNEKIRACTSAAELPLLYRIQMEVQCMVAGAEKILFMATNWNADDTLREEVHFWYEPDLKLRAEIDAAWNQFEADAANYTPPEVIPAAVAAPTLALPAVSIQVSGAVALTSNLGVFLTELKGFIAKLPEKPSTDQEFANCKAACKTLQEAQDALDAAEANALGQVQSFDEMKRAKALCFDLARNTRLALEKLVVAREKAIKEEIVMDGKRALADHIARLNARLGKPYMPVVPADFAGVIKSKRTIASLRDAVDTELARTKIAANEIADGIQQNITSLNELTAGYDFIRDDIGTNFLVMQKRNDDFVSFVQVRIAQYKEAEAKREEAQRERIRAEEQAKAQREAEAKIKAEQEAAQKAAAQQEPRRVQEARNIELAVAAAPKPSLRPSDIPLHESLAIFDGSGQLRALIGHGLEDFTPGELQQVLDAIRAIRGARKQQAVA